MIKSTVTKQRTTPPGSGNLEYVSTKKGGNNHAIVINSSSGSCLPNCVGYVNGRIGELRREKDPGYKYICINNAEEFVKHKDFEAGTTNLKAGDIMVWTNTIKNQHGHVAVIERVNEDGTVEVSASDYGGSRFYNKTIFPPYKWNNNLIYAGVVRCDIDIYTFADTNTTGSTIKVTSTNLRLRKGYGLDADAVGYCPTGTYTVYRMSTKDDYAWCKISDKYDLWIAIVEGCSEFFPGDTVKLDAGLTKQAEEDLSKLCDLVDKYSGVSEVLRTGAKNLDEVIESCRKLAYSLSEVLKE